MPLEDLTGNKYIDDLNENWPLGTDYPDAGDNHLRGIKNVLKKSFPAISGAMNRTEASLNTGAVPIGAKMLFYEAAAPTGWTRVSGLTTTAMVRVVESTSSGGGSGGTDDPVLNNKVVSHTHTTSGNSAVESVGHTHSGNTSAAGNHDHTYLRPDGVIGAAAGPNGVWIAAVNPWGTSVNGEHQHSMTTSGPSVSHVHGISLASGTPQGATVGSWAPRYWDMILCERTG